MSIVLKEVFPKWIEKYIKSIAEANEMKGDSTFFRHIIPKITKTPSGF